MKQVKLFERNAKESDMAIEHTTAGTCVADVAKPARRLRIEIRDSTDTAAAMHIWQELDERLGGDPLMCSAVWTRLWLKHYGEQIPHQFAIAHAGDRVVGICLLTSGVGQTNGPLSVKTVHIGTAGEPPADSVCVEYNAVLAFQEFRAAFVDQLIEHLLAQGNWDELHVDGFVNDELRPRLEQAGLQQHGTVEFREETCHYFDLLAARESSGDVLSQLGYSTRKHVRRNLKAYGDLTCEWAETVPQAEAIFEELVQLHQARWTAVGEPGSYASQRFLEFHRDLIRELVPAGRMVLFRVVQGDEVLGCLQSLIDRNRILCYQSGFTPYEGKLSPGVIVDFKCMEESLRRGFDAYDFLHGDTHHKRSLAPETQQLIWATLRQSSLRHKVLESLRMVKRAIVDNGSEKD